MSSVDITAPSVLRGIPKELREHVKGAALLGWTGRKRGQGGLILHSPDGEHSVTIPITVNRVNTAKQIARDLVRWTPDEVKSRVADEAIDGQHDDDVVALASLVRQGQGAFGPAVVSGLTYEQPEQTVTLPTEQVTQEPFIPEPAVTIVSAEPWMARVSSDGNRANLYPSKAVIERVWSDGSTDYMCAYCMTDFVSDKPRSVSNHYGRHTEKGETTGGVLDPTQFDVKVDGYRTVRVAHLAKEIEAALDSIVDDQFDTTVEGNGGLARFLATHIITDRLARGKEKVEEEPEAATPEEIVARMRALLLRDEHKQVQVAEAQAENLRKQIAEVEAERDRYKVQAKKRGEALQVMAALAEEEGGD